MQARIFTDKVWDTYYFNEKVDCVLKGESVLIPFEQDHIEIKGDFCLYLNHISDNSKADKTIARL